MKNIWVVLLLWSFAAGASVRLPLSTLRDQANTAHCWSYAMSHFLESRALLRESKELVFHIEEDTKFWVDFERMWAMYKTKQPFYLGDYEGGWQIEYWETVLKHGRPLYRSLIGNPTPIYPVLEAFTENLGFLVSAKPPHTTDTTLMTPDQATEKLLSSELPTDDDAIAFILNYVRRRYGDPTLSTTYFGETIELTDVAKQVLGEDFEKSGKVDGMVLVKPVTDGQFEWVKYLSDRYWGYRYDQAKLLALIQTSLDRGWPVTFDNVYHAMTIIGYEKTAEKTHYAVADSAPARITWYDEALMLREINLLTVAHEAVSDLLPAKPSTYQKPAFSYDLKDNVVFPPGSTRRAE